MKINQILLGLMLMASFVFTSCEKDESSTESVENFISQSTYEIEERCGVGAAGCYELVFPVTLQFADSTTTTVTSYEELKDALRTWYEANAPVRPRPFDLPQLVLPIEVINSDGEIISIETKEELNQLRRECAGNFRPNWKDHHSRPCFKPVFPYSLQFPDGSVVSVATPLEVQQAVRAYNLSHPGEHARPTLVFPLDVIKADGTTVTVNSKEELDALKEECRNG